MHETTNDKNPATNLGRSTSFDDGLDEKPKVSTSDVRDARLALDADAEPRFGPRLTERNNEYHNFGIRAARQSATSELDPAAADLQ